MQKNKGFSLVEILIAGTIVAFIIGFSAYFYFRLSQGSFSLDEGASFVVSVLNLAKQKAMVGEENANWGVLLKNNSGSPDYLYLFKNTRYNIIKSYQMPGGISFFNFNEKTVIFQKLTGETTPTTIIIGFSNGSEFRYIKIPRLGSIIIDTQP